MGDRNENGRVVMIVHANSPRRTDGPVGSPAGSSNNPLALSLSAMEADWRQQQFQRQRMQLLSMAIFLCFLVLFFDNRAGEARNARHNRASTDTSGHNRYSLPQNAFNDTDRVQKVHELEALLQEQPGYRHQESPLNVTGIYSGIWNSVEAEVYNANRPVYDDIIPYLKVDREIQLQQYSQPAEKGNTWLFLKMKAPASKELMTEVAYVTGQLVIYEEHASLAATILPVQGVFLRKLAKLTLFGNSPDSSVQILYRKGANDSVNAAAVEEFTQAMSEDDDGKLNSETLPNQSRGEMMNFGVLDGVPSVKNRDEYAAIDISPPKYSYVSRFRSSDSFSDQCVSIVEMMLVNDTSEPLDEEDEKLDAATMLQKSMNRMKLKGTLASVNCGLYLKIDTTFQEENLNIFFAKASRYAVIMTFIAMAEIYFLLRQLQISSTQATAAKVSLLTIGQQAIVDSYLCLGHLTVGIVAQNVFAAFASVAFVKLIIFSVFEMRYLLIIWKARRPQGFSEGWLTLRRELTTLYSRFYLSLCAGIGIFYNASNYLTVLVFICYSFWVPQIVHNAHKEVRNPFDAGYLYGISALRLFLPLYFYGCPDNFLTAFPMYESKVNPHFCYVLSTWMGLQVGILALQHQYGPRFFVPARFLPVRYNYERRINLQQLIPLKDSDNSIDCVICMVELDIEARDYMIAPCDHIFHRECLHGWMQVKMECPTCRHVLPEP
ncbi:zinc ion binding protein [Plasmopara halstedii]|uniref:RING-type E3 ubiquitin transferase n=1 Tax=Plasmopara halstedii TaxID=4781 RepID=A0A0P1AAH3_PLAHL|nr:zinc ion binding protein [Plasmopara halstedii]CEG37772.1 zinc ion binding protein [Plasmopara halstedii]|eukprot:XP_024574141.1 zinc ion binding protein [Plasmopara halstedii]